MRSSAKLAARLLRNSQSRTCHAAPTNIKSGSCPRFLSVETSKLSERRADTVRQHLQTRPFSAAATSDPLPNLIDVVKEELEFERGPEGSAEVSLRVLYQAYISHQNLLLLPVECALERPLKRYLWRTTSFSEEFVPNASLPPVVLKAAA